MRLTLAATLVLLAAVPALAQDPIVYTGCLRSSDGTLYSVRVGSAPMAPCKAKDKQISWNMAGQPGPQGPPGASIPQLLQLTVDCSQPDASINAALARQADMLIVSISGNCTEDVLITRDDVTLQGVGADPTITAVPRFGGGMRIEGAQRVVLRDLMVTGGGVARVALWVAGGAYVNAYNLKIAGAGNGLDVNANSWVSVDHCEIANNRVIGLGVTDAYVGISNSSIVDNHSYGLFLERAQAVISGTTVARQSGSNIYFSVVAFQQSTHEDFMGVDFSHVEVASSLSGRIDVHSGSAVMVNGGSTVNGGVAAWNGSTVALGQDVTIDGGGQPGISLSDTSTAGGGLGTVLTVSGNPVGVFCAGPPSVAQLTGEFVMNGTTNCLRSQ